jgi:hypothetical protein
MHQNPYAPPADHGQYPPAAPPLEVPGTVSVFDAIRFAFSSHVGFGNIALAFLLMIIPIVGPIVLVGWLAESHRRLARREGPPVLAFRFNDFVDYLMAGLVPFAAQMCATFIAVFPMSIFMGMGVAVAVPLFSGGGEPPIILILLFALFFCVVMLVVMVGVMVVMTSLQVRGELTGNFETTFNPAANWAFMKRQWKPIVGHSLLLGLVSIPLVFLGLIVFFIGIYFVAAALQFAQMHLRWQIYELDLRMGGEALPVRAGNGADL